ncbi:MAG: hypothetical protein ABIO04_07375 [Ferruginibacter sp.]
MKKIIPVLTLIIVFAACKNKAKDTEKMPVVLLQDTFQMHNNSVLTDKNGNAVPYVVVPVTPAVSKTTTPAKKTTTKSTSTNASTTSSNTSNSTATTPARKKGWSNSAKGAVIGGGTGAVAGAVIAGDGNRVGGAVIGSVVGAAGGYIIGKAKDKKAATKGN